MAARTLLNAFQAKASPTSVSAVNADATNGMRISPGGRLVFLVSNQDASSHTVTLRLPPPPDVSDATDRTVTIPAGSSRLIGPFPGDLYTQPTAADPLDVGFIHLDFDSALLNVIAMRL
jgi:hypothetical protein